MILSRLTRTSRQNRKQTLMTLKLPHQNCTMTKKHHSSVYGTFILPQPKGTLTATDRIALPIREHTCPINLNLIPITATMACA